MKNGQKMFRIPFASKNNDPVKQGIIGSLGSFLDTLVVCTMTALVILVSGLIEIGTDKVMMITTTTGNLVKVTEIPSAGTEAYATFVSQFGKPLTGAALTTTAFSKSLVGFGSFIVSFGLVFFAFSTILGWYYYGSKCLEYIAGVKIIVLYKIAWISLCWIGAFIPLRFVWNISDTFNGLMAIPNLIALLTLSPLIFKMTSDYERREKRR
jgi:AGCS family alanine or glycine:cation symporter